MRKVISWWSTLRKRTKVQFQFPLIRVFTIPTDAGPNDDRIVIDGVNGTISFFEGSNLFGKLTTSGGIPGYFIFGSDGSQVALQTVIATGETQIENLTLGNVLRIANARIETDTIQSATGPVGTVVGKLEVFNQAGVSEGFIPVYDTIT